MNIIQVGRPAVSRYHHATHSVIVTGGLGLRKNDCFHMFDRKVAVASGAPGREVVGPPGPLELTRTLNTASFF